MDAITKFKEDYISNLMFNQNLTNDISQKNLCSREDYENILKPVLDVINDNPDASLEELRETIFQKSGLLELVNDFVYKRGLTPSLSIAYGTKNYKEFLSVGKINDETLANLDTIYDIASVTKLFTSISILTLSSQGGINLNDKVGSYLPEFKNISDVTILELLTFNKPLITDKRIDAANSYDEAMDIMKNIKVNENFDNNKNPYTDLGAMVLKYIVEKVTGKGLYDFVYENVINKANMKDTHIIIPDNKLIRTASTNNIGYYYDDGNFRIRDNIQLGIVNDEKAQILGQGVKGLAGHAGIFSTSDDMSNLALAMIAGDILDKEIINSMSENRTGKKIAEDLYKQYFGMLCYSKNPKQADSEIFHPLSGKTLANGGWTGCQFTVDPLNELYFFLGANRTNNRMAFIGSERKKEILKDSNGKESIILPNGIEMINSTRFAWERDSDIVHPAIKLSMCYDFLEKVYQIQQNEITQKSRTL